ncbi:MAG: hypothetical protein HY731_13345 [Candidatus Tectomicrobia bacterium]|nr:hypothetical protein [Candidatus Tectomicrobia bacterium]
MNNTSPGLNTFPEAQPLDDIVEIPTDVGKRHEPVIKGKGVPVWVLVSYVMKRDLTPEQISHLWKGYITPQEVRAALIYWHAHPEAVVDKLSDTEQ